MLGGLLELNDNLNHVLLLFKNSNIRKTKNPIPKNPSPIADIFNPVTSVVIPNINSQIPNKKAPPPINAIFNKTEAIDLKNQSIIEMSGKP